MSQVLPVRDGGQTRVFCVVIEPPPPPYAIAARKVRCFAAAWSLSMLFLRKSLRVAPRTMVGLATTAASLSSGRGRLYSIVAVR